MLHLIPEAVKVLNDTYEKADVLEALIRLLCETHGLDMFDIIADHVFDRESKLSTGIGLGIAVPHCRVGDIGRIYTAAVLVDQPVDYGAVDGVPVRLLFLIVSPLADIRGHVACLSSISQVVADEESRRQLIASDSGEELYRRIGRLIR